MGLENFHEMSLAQLLVNMISEESTTTSAMRHSLHIDSVKHKDAQQRKKQNSEREMSQLLISNHQQKRGPNLSESNMDLCKTLIVANIPLNKLNHPSVVQFIEKYTSQSVPDQSTLRRNYVPHLYEKSSEKLRLKADGEHIWVALDETTDIEKISVANFVFGILDDENERGKSYLLNVKELDKCDANTIAIFFTESMLLLWPKEQSVEWRSPLCQLFVDFERAFDTLNRRAIWSTSRTNGVPEKIVTIIQELYEGAACSVLFKGETSELFSIHNGVRQGGVSSPLLLITVLDDIIRKTNIDIPSGIHWRPYQKLCDLDYADDICFLTHKLSEAHAKLTALIRYASQVGLRDSFKKTKLIRIETPNQDAQTLEEGGTLVTIEDIGNFCYLGSIVSKNGGAEADDESNLVIKTY
ncbi:uncharacterized protein LOC128867182 [Anastrepha ludens]|uniref:uncharacterized protein LOC128867182 n=1 Tax=Anastrepha ludens TaxID=28586 RepID=UPI0023AEDFC3|nr:uncharacterized protein LOC128867182 [Anastrepha ludens]